MLTYTQQQRIFNFTKTFCSWMLTSVLGICILLMLLDFALHTPLGY